MPQHASQLLGVGCKNSIEGIIYQSLHANDHPQCFDSPATEPLPVLADRLACVCAPSLGTARHPARRTRSPPGKTLGIDTASHPRSLWNRVHALHATPHRRDHLDRNLGIFPTGKCALLGELCSKAAASSVPTFPEHLPCKADHA